MPRFSKMFRDGQEEEGLVAIPCLTMNQDSERRQVMLRPDFVGAVEASPEVGYPSLIVTTWGERYLCAWGIHDVMEAAEWRGL